MDKNTDCAGAARPHIDTLTVVYGHAIAITAVETIRRSDWHSDHRDDVSPWLALPAGRGA